MRKNKKAFTLIELVAVLVILAIIALIVTPLVMNIVNKARESANKRSVDAYGKAVELAVTTYLLDNGDYPTDISSLTIEYSGNEVVCTTKKLNEDGSVYLSGCSVNGTEVKDSKTDDGYYHYGKTTGTPSEPAGYKAYNIGDMVTYNGIDFYVIEASDETKDSVTLLKSEPLTVDDVNTYGSGHVNMYVTAYPSEYYYQKAYDLNGYGGMAYYSGPNCGYDSNGNFSESACIADYVESEVKYVVDAWANDKLNISDLRQDKTGYSVRLLTIEELTNNLGYSGEPGMTYMGLNSENTPSWVYNNNYGYWTMSSLDDYPSNVWGVNYNGSVYSSTVWYYNSRPAVRPVITLSKNAI